jgi:hypothetical protein
MCSMEILAPTFLEYWAVKHILPQAHVSWTGVRLARWKEANQGSIVIVCGLAGALTPNLQPGTILVPEMVGLADGNVLQCDPALVQALTSAAHSQGYRPESGPLLTASSMIVGDARHYWYKRGFVAADMETGLLAGKNLRVATIRVVLDTPEQSLSSDWLQATRALLQPKLWRQLIWLSLVAPRYALRAAHILSECLKWL